MELSALIFSRDERAARILKLLLFDLSIRAEVFTEFGQAENALFQQKYDGVFAECEEKLGAELLKSVQRSKHNRRSVAFALSSTAVKVGSAFELGAHFVIHKPLVVEKVKRTLKAAHGLMMREQRIYYRHSASAHVTVRIENGSIFHAALRDLSQNGALIEAGTVLKKNQTVQLRFILPDTPTAIEARARVTWSDPAGRAGVRFETVSEEAHQELIRWVLQRSEEGQETKADDVIPAATDAVEIEIHPEDHFEMDVEVEEPDQDNRLRATLRGQYEARIKVLTFESERPVVVEGDCSNLSEKGLSAELQNELPHQVPVLISVVLPAAETAVVIAAEIRYREESRYGFEFLGVPPAIRALLRESVQQLPVE